MTFCNSDSPLLCDQSFVTKPLQSGTTWYPFCINVHFHVWPELICFNKAHKGIRSGNLYYEHQGLTSNTSNFIQHVYLFCTYIFSQKLLIDRCECYWHITDVLENECLTKLWKLVLWDIIWEGMKCGSTLMGHWFECFFLHWFECCSLRLDNTYLTFLATPALTHRCVLQNNPISLHRVRNSDSE